MAVRRPLADSIDTDVALATTVEGVTTTFHVLFILGIILATIVFCHAAIRFFLTSKRRSNHLPTFVRVTRHHGRRGETRRHHGHVHPHVRHMPSLVSEHDDAYLPPTPIQVQVPGDEIRTGPSRALPTLTTQDHWNKDIQPLSKPPPAYGKRRDSVRANPDLLHWARSPVSPDAPALPSPTYEEAMAAQQENRSSSHPPSYMTRDSPARRMNMQEARAGTATSQVASPEMVETRPVPVGKAFGQAV